MNSKLCDRMFPAFFIFKKSVYLIRQSYRAKEREIFHPLTPPDGRDSPGWASPKPGAWALFGSPTGSAGAHATATSSTTRMLNQKWSMWDSKLHLHGMHWHRQQLNVLCHNTNPNIPCFQEENSICMCTCKTSTYEANVPACFFLKQA